MCVTLAKEAWNLHTVECIYPMEIFYKIICTLRGNKADIFQPEPSYLFIRYVKVD